MKSYRCARYLSLSRRGSLLVRVGERLAAAVRIRRHKLYAVRRRPLSARLADSCRCLFERLNTQWSRAACKTMLAAATLALTYMIVGNYLQQSFSGEIQRLSVEKQQREKEHVLIQAELTNLVKKNQDRLGLVEGKPEQLLRMN